MEKDEEHLSDRNTPVLVRPVHPLVDTYLLDLARAYDDPVLLEMEALAARHEFPVIGRLVGSFVHLLTLAIGARDVFEFGSGYGYSTWWFARAVGPEGRVIATDGDPDNRLRAHRFLERAGLWDRVRFEVGRAQALFRQIDGTFDIIYNDVDKGDYPEVWELARGRLRPGGLYIADNTLWGGRVLFQKVDEDEQAGWTEAIKEHNRCISSDPDFDFFLNPTRDGVIVARRKGRG